MKIAFRVDASLEMGSGHVMRCLTLADELARSGHQCLFICRAHPGNLNSMIFQRGYPCFELLCDPSFEHDSIEGPAHSAWLGCDWQADVDQTRLALEGFHADWLVLDHYALEQRWQQRLQSYCRKLMVVDDLADRQHSCDLLLDQTHGRDPQDYKHRVSKTAGIITGAEYALLRPEFSLHRDASLARRDRPSLSRLLINLGGVDKDNITGKVLDALVDCPLPTNSQVTVVMGATAPWIDCVTEQAARMPWLTEVKSNVSNMAELMRDSDLAIGAAGSTSWERCCMGLPCLMLVIAQNQRYAAMLLEQAGAAMVINFGGDLNLQLKQSISSLRESPALLNEMSMHARRITDGTGAQRVVACLENQSSWS